jgi:predicted enzyme related to lactoylglutathione lyase
MPVELGYFTLKVADLARAKAFYGALFGWTFEEGSTHVANTKFPLGLAAGGPVDVSDSVYFRVADLEAILPRVAELGGEVRGRATYPSGPNATIADDQGTVLSLWQPAPGYE